MSKGDKIAYAYIKNIKRWIACPVCHRKMIFRKDRKSWVCDHCNYSFTEKEFLDDFVFWFCDECNMYLNHQDCFDKNGSKHICQNCGYENDTTRDNIKGMCIDCGKVISNPDASLCDECKQVRRQKAKKRLINAGKVIGVTALVAGVVYVASRGSDDVETKECTPLSGGDDDYEGGSTMSFDYVTENWMQGASEDELRTVESEMRSAVEELDYDSDEYLQLDLIRIDVVNTISSRFPLNLPHREHGWYLPNDD